MLDHTTVARHANNCSCPRVLKPRNWPCLTVQFHLICICGRVGKYCRKYQNIEDIIILLIFSILSVFLILSRKWKFRIRKWKFLISYITMDVTRWCSI